MTPGYKLYIYLGYYLDFDRPTYVSLIQNKSYQLSPQKTKNNGGHERQY